jgi:outer membrane receptor for ferrienterochelin and colicin
VDTALVGKFAVGWNITDWLLFRGSISTAYRAPNIIQVNEKIVVRTGTRNDYSSIDCNKLMDIYIQFNFGFSLFYAETSIRS